MSSTVTTLTVAQAVCAFNHGQWAFVYAEGLLGICCDPFCEPSLIQISILKKRPLMKGFLCIVASPEQIEPYLNCSLTPQDRHKLIAGGKDNVSYVLPTKPSLSHYLVGTRESLAVRVTAHPTLKQLCQLKNTPLMSTSANLHGLRTASTPLEACQQMNLSKALFVKSRAGCAKSASKILDFFTDTVLRD